MTRHIRHSAFAKPGKLQYRRMFRRFATLLWISLGQGTPNLLWLMLRTETSGLNPANS